MIYCTKDLIHYYYKLLYANLFLNGPVFWPFERKLTLKGNRYLQTKTCLHKNLKKHFSLFISRFYIVICLNNLFYIMYVFIFGYEAAQEALCLSLEWRIVQSDEQCVQIATTLQSTPTGRLMFETSLLRQLHLKELVSCFFFFTFASFLHEQFLPSPLE